MADTRHKDGNWSLPTNSNGNIRDWTLVQVALLMDLRDELKKLNRTFDCPNFQAMPRFLRRAAIAMERLDKRAAAKKPPRARRGA